MSHAVYEETMTYLEEEGYRPEAAQEDRIHFRAEGGIYLVDFDWDDPQFVRLIFPNFWSIDDELERERVLKAADEANGKIKCAKVWTQNNRVCVSIELFLPDPSTFPEVIERAMSAIRSSRQEFSSHARASARPPATLAAVHSSGPN